MAAHAKGVGALLLFFCFFVFEVKQLPGTKTRVGPKVKVFRNAARTCRNLAQKTTTTKYRLKEKPKQQTGQLAALPRPLQKSSAIIVLVVVLLIKIDVLI